MTKPTRTPGPWQVEPLQWDHGASIAIVANGQIICTIAPRNEEDEPNMHTAIRGPHDEANAALIAAAPDLLEAAEKVIASWESGDLAGAVRELNNAIDNARGE